MEHGAWSENGENIKTHAPPSTVLYQSSIFEYEYSNLTWSICAQWYLVSSYSIPIQAVGHWVGERVTE
jgi:hypothetical protein